MIKYLLLHIEKCALVYYKQSVKKKGFKKFHFIRRYCNFSFSHKIMLYTNVTPQDAFKLEFPLLIDISQKIRNRYLTHGASLSIL